jgi:hypothetical protein
MLEVVQATQPRLGVVEGDNVLAAISSPDDNLNSQDDTRYP